jgi:putative redox protein
LNITARHGAGAVFELSARGHRLTSDNSPEYGGTDLGLMPSELMLCAVASCFGQAVQHVAKKMRREIKDLVLEVSGVKDAGQFRYNALNIRLSSSGPAQQLEKVAGVAKKYCFVVNSLAVPVTYEVIESRRE